MTTKQGMHTRTGHTPGPWTCHSGSVYQDGPDVFPKGDNNGVCIALMDREPTTPTMPTERDANARLIAAAPELLEALTMALAALPADDTTAEQWAEMRSTWAYDNIAAKCEAVIDKATGEVTT